MNLAIQERVNQLHASDLFMFGLIRIAPGLCGIPSMTQSWSFQQQCSLQDYDAILKNIFINVSSGCSCPPFLPHSIICTPLPAQHVFQKGKAWSIGLIASSLFGTHGCCSHALRRHIRFASCGWHRWVGPQPSYLLTIRSILTHLGCSFHLPFFPFPFFPFCQGLRSSFFEWIPPLSWVPELWVVQVGGASASAFLHAYEHCMYFGFVTLPTPCGKYPVTFPTQLGVSWAKIPSCIALQVSNFINPPFSCSTNLFEWN